MLYDSLPSGWINEDFRKTCSYSEKIRQFSRHYKTFTNILEVRMLPSEYDVAMKLASLRPYKYDMSDVVGIINSEKMSRELLDSVFSTDNLGELYESTRLSEYDNHVILKDIDDNYPDCLSQGNLTSVLEAAKRKKNSS